MKTILVRYRRWGLTLVILLAPIVYNIVSNVTSENSSALGTFKMDVDALDPQTILYGSDPSMERYFQAAIKSDDIILQNRLTNISEMNQYIRRECCLSLKRKTNQSVFFDYFS